MAAAAVIVAVVFALVAQTPSPSPTRRVIDPPPTDPLATVAAIVAIALAIVAGVIGYRIIRGGRGL